MAKITFGGGRKLILGWEKIIFRWVKITSGRGKNSIWMGKKYLDGKK